MWGKFSLIKEENVDIMVHAEEIIDLQQKKKNGEICLTRCISKSTP